MEIGDIISESFKYPLNNGSEFLKVSALFLLLVIPAVFLMIFAPMGYRNTFSTVFLVLMIVMIIFYIIFALIGGGYFLSVMKEGIDKSGLIPGYDFAKNIVDSFKLWVLSFIFSIIPLVIILILMFLVAGVGVSSNNQTVLGAGFIIVAIIALILEIIFGIFLIISILRLAHYDSLSESLSFSAIREDLSAIGIGNFIIIYIVFTIVALAILFVGAFILLIPIVGIIVYMMFIMPYVYLAMAYGFGLMYSEIV